MGQEKIKIDVYYREKKKICSTNLEEQILNILAFDIKEHFHIEVLKAHAIMIRTYLFKKMRRFDGRGCALHPQADICNDPNHCMGCIETKDIPKDIKEPLETAIKDTAHRVITFGGSFIHPYYHHTCGGATQNAENFLGNTIRYTRKVLCDHCKHTSPHWQTTVDISIEEMEKLLNVRFPKSTPLQGATVSNIIDQVERDQEGRIVNIKIGDKWMKGTEIQQKLGLPSSRFGWQPTKFRFYVQGKGHGLGLCQYGAQKLALDGMKAEEILKYYFTGIQIERIPQWSINMPLQGKIILIDPGHGGKDKGIFKQNVQEKDRNLKIALHLEKILKEAGSTVVLTRTEDKYVSLGQRLAINNKLHPHFMLSIHGNDNPAIKSTVNQIYIYPGDEEAYRLGQNIISEFKDNGLDVQEIIEGDLFLTRESKNSTLILDIGYFSSQEDYGAKIATCIYHALLSYWTIDKA
ncbi:N-acetylmuramoyl-L-alanine amidase [Irregularibacter muris]|uniref:N-acetylmuramoyl-L-alanine amidase n=1 Tax=Irregularibacter muris TaxID=1796619 RepID=A0AAE3HH73_9FIRM|nr:N-acetylmuramoyl-L-alanine amidase [Irregularibacter muris]MCR1899497.1 N-acetylmuramoyl-L-alanine amidase [Irregularibacter muris]